MATTSQINPEEARAQLEPFLKEGKDVLHLGFSSGLSGTYNSMRIAGEELKEEYPEAKDHHHRYALRMPWRGTAAL